MPEDTMLDTAEENSGAQPTDEQPEQLSDSEWKSRYEESQRKISELGEEARQLREFTQHQNALLEQATRMEPQQVPQQPITTPPGYPEVEPDLYTDPKGWAENVRRQAAQEAANAAANTIVQFQRNQQEAAALEQEYLSKRPDLGQNRPLVNLFIKQVMAEGGFKTMRAALDEVVRRYDEYQKSANMSKPKSVSTPTPRAGSSPERPAGFTPTTGVSDRVYGDKERSRALDEEVARQRDLANKRAGLK